ncbi:FAD-dependent monooxygenase [Citricoccus sp. SGAir0253]|uniref:FAD-dependent monooxygenase n=1 Tax=Citricoccus sp. SGAir0253 TaxID=2567881 RepID=UPI001FEE169D|nr:FAD-dependent monooxygenase [Citricoccus sp. SGAir0253]
MPGPPPAPGATPSARAPRVVSTDVLVVGAGPTGLMAGAWCARLGLRAVVVDAKAGPTRESRALGLQSRSLEVYRQLGLAEAVEREAVLARNVSPGVGRHRLGTVHLDRIGHGLTPFPGLHVLEQSANERILAEHLAAVGRPVAWRHAFRSLGTTPEGRPAVGLDSPTGPVTVRARYVIAADGASSPVRHALGTPFEGSTSPYEFYVLDATGVEGLGDGIEIRFSGEHFMLAFPMGRDERGGRRSRLLGILRAEDLAGAEGGEAAPDDGAVRLEARARAALAERFSVTYAGVSWFSRYRVHHRVAAAFRTGAVFLAGDAAHIHSPVGAQGMNTGLQDAQDLVCALADVLAGRADESRLERYEAERRPVALTLVRSTDRVFAAVTSLRPFARVVRSAVVPVVLPVVLRLVPRSPAGGRLFGYLSQTRIHYWMGPGPRRPPGQPRGRVVGRRLPWVPDAGHEGPVPGGDGRGDNHEALCLPRWQVHAYGPAALPLALALAEEHRDLAVDHRTGSRRPAVPALAVAAGAGPEPGAGPDGPASGLPVFAFRAAPEARLPDGTAVLVRPDGFVAELRLSPR